eukprot:gnl/MRDRNA2_/MRDRNA2_72456_c1_seq3.p1 gnl/MRDRNA2_/MRDRNA2_72456_c1~~gnl/MRDRNA2_/MRDRNA2_72456_c1_seq3.p1  ORF type:complete len:148 (-),score=24.48 gnl/MRDRNA2_/MRDRNA2_72456_c1_seq3:126-569(-)
MKKGDDDLAGRNCAESWKQARREHADDRKRARRGWDESKERRMMITDRNHEEYCKDTGKRYSPAELTNLIREASTIEAVLHTYSTSGSHFDHVHLSACWTSCGRLARRSAEQRWLHCNAELADLLVKHTVQAARLGKLLPRQLAGIA